jgi:hypothetical protein
MKSNNNSLGDLIKEFLRVSNLEEKVTETRILTIWEKVMGPGISKYTSKMVLNRGTLSVFLTSSVLRNELSMGKTRLIKMLNTELGQDEVKEIIFK